MKKLGLTRLRRRWKTAMQRLHDDLCPLGVSCPPGYHTTTPRRWTR